MKAMYAVVTLCMILSVLSDNDRGIMRDRWWEPRFVTVAELD
jgi:hypothetical protein